MSTHNNMGQFCIQIDLCPFSSNYKTQSDELNPKYLLRSVIKRHQRVNKNNKREREDLLASQFS